MYYGYEYGTIDFPDAGPACSPARATAKANPTTLENAPRRARKRHLVPQKNTTGRRQANVGRFTGDPAHRRGRAGSICGGVAGVAPSQRLPARGFLPVRGPGPPSLPHARGRAPGQPAPGRIRSISCAKGKACAARLQCRPTGQGVRAGVAIHPDGKQASAGGRRATAAGASRSFPRRKKPGARWQRQGGGNP